METIFAYNTPVGRLQYLFTNLAIGVATKLLDLAFVAPDTDDMTVGLTILAILASIAFLTYLMVVNVYRRMVDLGWERNTKRFMCLIVLAGMVTMTFQVPVMTPLLALVNISVGFLLAFKAGGVAKSKRVAAQVTYS